MPEGERASGRRILGVVASLRAGGSSEYLTRVALGAAASLGASADIVLLGDLDIRFCRGCLACVYAGGCRQKDDVEWLYSTAATYDGIILASPVLALGAPGQVKTLVDRGVAQFPRLLGRKARPTATITVYSRPGGVGFARPVINQLGALLGGRLVGGVAVEVGAGVEALSPEVLARVAALGRAVATDRGLASAPGLCPVCHLPRAGREGEAGPCPFCLHDPAKPDSLGDHRFTPAHLAAHLAEWMLPSRERYLAHRAEVEAARGRVLESELPRISPPPLGSDRATSEQ